jgi:AGCS family alanine or glycine:cation symporter
MSFSGLLPGSIGQFIVSLSLVFFAYSTILGWSYYGEKSIEYLFDEKAVKPYRIIFVIFVALGAVLKLEIVWMLADIMNGLMALPNLIGLLGLSAVIASETNKYYYNRKK